MADSWIKVSPDSLPAPYADVLLCGGPDWEGKVYAGYLARDGEWFARYWSFASVPTTDPLYWQPFPAAKEGVLPEERM